MARTVKKPTIQVVHFESDDDEEPPTDQGAARHRIPTKRLQEATDDANTKKADRASAKALREVRAGKRRQHAEEAATVVIPGDREKIMNLEEMLSISRAQRDAAEHKLAALQQAKDLIDEHLPNAGSIPKPSRLDGTSAASIRRDMGLDGSDNDDDWLGVRMIVRDDMRRGTIEWDLKWKAQHPRKLSKIYDAIEERVPALRRFKHNWATEVLVKNTFSAHKAYENGKSNLNSYQGRARLRRKELRRRQRESSLPSADDEGVDEESLENEDSSDHDEGDSRSDSTNSDTVEFVDGAESNPMDQDT